MGSGDTHKEPGPTLQQGFGNPHTGILKGISIVVGKTFKRPLGWLRKPSNGQANMAPRVDDNPSSRRCFWPADLLARDFPDVRVLTYGYESQVAKFFSTLNLSTITQHSQDLLSRLTSERHEYPERPLIFIAHSLGGLLVKGALNESALHQGDDPQRRISRECRMVMFFGTPHRGSDFAQWGSALANIASVLGFSVNTRIVQNLARESEILQRLERDFEGIIAQRDTSGRKFVIYTFQEAKAVGGPFNKQVVSDSSSHYNRRDVEISFRINDNHMDMCRFKGPGDENYKVLKKELVQYLKPLRESKKAPKSLLDYRVVRRDSRGMWPAELALSARAFKSRADSVYIQWRHKIPTQLSSTWRL
ncbi:hypothetical protein BDW69DRAFT_169782 [Aspergillus filifer]